MAEGMREHNLHLGIPSPHPKTSILGKVEFGSISYIDMEKVVIQNQIFKIVLGQTAPPKMTAMTIGWY